VEGDQDDHASIIGTIRRGGGI